MNPTSEILERIQRNFIIRHSMNGKPCTSRGVSTVWREACANRHWKQCTAALVYSTCAQKGVIESSVWCYHPQSWVS